MGTLSIGSSENHRSRKVISVKGIFDTIAYPGSSSQNVDVITGFDMTQGQYLVKIKNKNIQSEQVIYDTIRGSSKEINLNKNSENTKKMGLSSFNTRGFVINDSLNLNNFGNNYIATIFKKTEKFFDIVEYTGDGTSNRTISHQLNCDIGLISIKALDIYHDWIVRHKDAIGELAFNTSSAQFNSFTDIVDISKTYFKVSNNANLLSVKYIAYLFANDTEYTGKIQCGTYIGGNTLITNTLTNSGKLIIPEGVDKITITCKGGSGGNNIWYDPGQPYIAPTAEQKYAAAVYGWKYVDDYSITSTTPITLEVWNNYNHVKPVAPVVQPTQVSDPLDPNTVVYVGWWTGSIDKPVFWSGHYSGYLISEEKPFIAANPGQPYIAPSTGGGIFKGNFSTFSLNEINYNFEGGNGGPAVPETKVISLIDSKNRILSYNIAPGGSLVYSYLYGGDTDVTLNYTLPSIKFSTNLIGSGVLIIPQDITSVTLNCSGGIGKNDAWTNPGQPYKAPQQAINQRGLPQYPNGLPIYVAKVEGVVGQGSPAYPTGLPSYIAPIAGRSSVAQVGLSQFPNGLPVYVAGTAGGAGQQGLPAYPNGLPVYKPATVAGNSVGNPTYPAGLPVYVAEEGNSSFPTGLPVYSAGPPVVGDPAYPTGLPAYKAAVGNSSFPLGLPKYVAATVDSPAVGNIAYPNGLPPYVAGTAATTAVGDPVYPNGLPPYVAAVSSIAPVSQQGLPAYPNGLPFYVKEVKAVTGQGKATYPDGLEPYIAAIPATPEQLYKPPTSGGGDILGESSTFSLNNETFTFPGSFGIKTARVYTQNIILNGKTTQSLIYNIPITGSLNVSYDIPNYDTTIESTFEPYYLIIKKLTDTGNWYEIDCRDKDHHFILNNQDPLIESNLIELKKNGFIASSLLVNELNQHYAYLVIRK